MNATAPPGRKTGKEWPLLFKGSAGGTMDQRIELEKGHYLLGPIPTGERMPDQLSTPLRQMAPSRGLSEVSSALRYVRGQLLGVSAETAGLIDELQEARAKLVHCRVKWRAVGREAKKRC